MWKRCIAMLLFLLLPWVFLLIGCGGGGGGGNTPFIGDKLLLGSWLDTAPYGGGSGQPDENGFWPTGRLILSEGGTFRYEEGSPNNFVTGTFSAGNNLLVFHQSQTQGLVSFYAGDNVTFSFINDNTLGIVGSTPEGDRGMQLARLAPDVPVVLMAEWLVARRIASSGAELPCLDSTRFTVDSIGMADMARYQPIAGVLTTLKGTLLFTYTSHLGMQVAAGVGTPGHLYFLGKCSLINSTILSMQGADGVQTLLVQRVAPNTKLIGEWQRQVGGITESLSLYADGSYAMVTGTGTITGIWRNYQSGYLCLISADTQRTFTWSRILHASEEYLILGEWTATDPTNPKFTENAWKMVK